MQEFIPKDARSKPGRDVAIAKPVRRFGIGVNVLLQCVLAVIILGFVNYLGIRHYKRWDLTRGNDYTLSSTTTNFVESLDEPMQLVVAFSRGSALGQDVSALVAEYQRRAPKKIEILQIDPARDSDKLREITRDHGLEIGENGVIVISGERSRMVGASEMIYAPKNNQRRLAAGPTQPTKIEFYGEDAITSAMISVSEGSRRTLYILAGKGKLRRSDQGTALDKLEAFARRQNARIVPLQIENAETIPDDADGIILVNALYDLTDREVQMVRDYWERRRGGVLCLLNPDGTTPRLNSFLAENGIRPRIDRVMYASSTGTGSKKEFSVQSQFVPVHSMTKQVWGVVTTFAGETQSLQVDEGSEELQKRTIEVKPLLEAANRYWGETKFRERLPTLGPEDHSPPIYVAASAELGALADERLRIDSSRMVVVGNATLIDPDIQISSNYDFVGMALNWILDREELIGIAPKIKQRHQISLTPEQHQRIFWIVAITLPGTVMAFGFFVWSLRRA